MIKSLEKYIELPQGSRLMCLPKKEGTMDINNVRPIANPDTGSRVLESIIA